jgi:two-component system nitrogen regulation sensor histidine kinase NtrY
MKKRLYLLFFILSAVFWLLASAYLFYNHFAQKPEGMVHTIQDDIRHRQMAVNKLFSNEKLMKHLWLNQLSEHEFRILENQGFVLHLYENSKLVFWSKNDFPVKEDRFLPRITTVEEQGNVFLYQSYTREMYPGKQLNVIIPVYRHYDVANEYLKPGFAASESLPASLRISFTKGTGTHQVLHQDKSLLFYLSDNGIAEPFKPGAVLLALIALALLCTILTVQTLGIYIVRRYSAGWGIAFVSGTIVLARVMVYWFGLPFNLEYLELFSPHVFASNSFLPSFGHLFFHVLCIYWLLSFAIAQKKEFGHLHWNTSKPLYCWIMFFTTLILLIVFCFYLQYLVQAIVFDSDISFDTNTFNATDKFTFLALIIIAIIARILLLSFQLANAFFEKCIQNKPRKYFVIIIVLGIMLLLHRYLILNDKPWLAEHTTQNWLDAVAVLWAVVYIRLIDIKYIKTVFAKSGLFSLIFISVYFSMLFALYFKFYIDEKEMNVSRVAFAEKLSRKQDIELELRFEQIDKNIQKDLQLQSWLEGDDTLSIQDVYKHFKVHNSELYFTKYSEDLFLYKADGRPVIANQRMPLDSLVSLRSRSLPTLSPFLFFNIDQTERGAYLVLVPVRKSATKELLGYLGINFKIKQNISQSLYPNLIKNGSETEYKSESRYNYAFYSKGKLVNQYGNFNFDYTIPARSQTVTYVKRGDVSLLYYKAAVNRVYVVVYKNNILVGVITIFSFLFGIFLFIAAVENWLILLVSAWMSGKKITAIYNTSISVRVKYFALGFTAVSFFIIGLSTIIFLTNRYQVSSLDMIQQNIANTTDAVSDYLQNEEAYSRYETAQDEITSSGFVFFLTNLSQQQKMDINIFDSTGKLAFTTQDNIYESKVLDDIMSASAFQIMKKKKLSSFIQPEKVGSLEYTASYAPIFRENKLIGYLNIPSFYIKQRLDSQIVSLITTLVNIYTILLLISSIITFLFINTLTKSLRMVADSLKNVSLTNNTLINWPYKDEIGLLIDEYNKMVATVEKNARSLVLDERQSAWREMAQQVAHEIKNPLTPMKLNIQYLQQAINSNHPDIINLTRRVSSSIIEQIDNLNYIASEFSNFAKMPENKTERIELKGMLERIVLLFSGNKNLVVSHSFPDVPVEVYADKSQMLRIFTNIVQNAVESIPTDLREGHVDIQVVYEMGNEVLIRVKDNGTGIPDEVKDKIFDPYFTTKSSGTGLGLAMTKKIIELWGGSIRFESVPDEGTTFILTIPMA